jgi:hypothetical protein
MPLDMKTSFDDCRERVTERAGKINQLGALIRKARHRVLRTENLCRSRNPSAGDDRPRCFGSSSEVCLQRLTWVRPVQARSLLSIARLNMARSRVRPSTINRVLIAHTCFGRSGGLARSACPYSRACSGRALKVDFHCLAWPYSSVAEGEEHASPQRGGAAKSCRLSEGCGR